MLSAYLAGNTLRGCVPPSLRTVANNDIASLGLSDCGTPGDISYNAPVLSGGTYKFILKEGDPPFIFDVPTGIELEVVAYVFGSSLYDQQGRKLYGNAGLELKVVGGDSWIVLDMEVDGVEWNRWIDPSGAQQPTGESIDALFDQVVESSWVGVAE